MKERKRFCIMAHPRSGTHQASAILRAYGYDVLHETEMGQDGISSWLFCIENPRWGPDPDKYRFIDRIHLVRNPVMVISSMLRCVPDGVAEYMDRVAGIRHKSGHTVRAVERYLFWHKLIRSKEPNMIVKVEDFSEHMSKHLGKWPPLIMEPTNIREHMMGVNVAQNPHVMTNLTVTDIESALAGREEMYHEFRGLCAYYRYSVA